jgi:hypothetical protein
MLLVVKAIMALTLFYIYFALSRGFSQAGKQENGTQCVALL